MSDKKKTPAPPTSSERKLLDFIGQFESKGGDYNILYGGYKEETKKPLTEMTVKEVFDLQEKMKASGSSAVGAHQFIKSTLSEEIKKQKIPLDSLFTPELQDSLMVSRLKKTRGFDKFLNGDIDSTTFAKNLSQEFASMPNPETGSSYYDGDGLNKSLVDVDSVLNTLDGIRSEKVQEETVDGNSSINPEIIETNSNIDEGTREELIKLNQSEGLSKNAEEQLTDPVPSMFSTIAGYGNIGKPKLNNIVEEEVEHNEDVLEKKKTKRGFNKNINALPESIPAFSSEFKLLNNMFNKGGKIQKANKKNALNVLNKSPRKGGKYNKDNTISSHLMRSGTSEGKPIAYPSLFQNEKEEWYEPDDPFREAINKNELYKFKTNKEAQEFAKGNWKMKTKNERYMNQKISDNSYAEGGGLINKFNTGGSHAEMPQGGIAISQNPQGGQNLVQKDETKYGDYIFSNEIVLDKDTAKRFNIDKKYIGKDLAEISERYNAELEARPFDKIVEGTVKKQLDKLTMVNESLRPKETQGEDKAFFGGGSAMGVTDALQEADGAGGVGGVAGAMGLAKGALGIGQDLFGKTNIDTTGLVEPEEVKTRGGSALSGAMNAAGAAASTGNPFLVAGAAVGGGIAGLLKGGRENRAHDRAVTNVDKKQAADAMPSLFRTGGNTNHIGKKYEGVLEATDPYDNDKLREFLNNEKLKDITKETDLIDDEMNYQEDMDLSGIPSNRKLKRQNNKVNRQNNRDKSGVENFLGKYGNDAMRLFPIARNLFKKGPKAETTTFDKLDNRFKESRIDETNLQNRIDNAAGNTRRALHESSGGNAGKLSSDLLQSQINTLRGTNDAFFQNQNFKAGQSQLGQNFNKDTDVRNQQITSAQTIANEQNRAAAQAQKDAMRSAGIEDLGLYGKENKLGRILAKTTGYTTEGDKYDPDKLGFLSKALSNIFGNKSAKYGGLLEIDEYLKKKYDGK